MPANSLRHTQHSLGYVRNSQNRPDMSETPQTGRDVSKVMNMANGRPNFRRPFALVSNYDFSLPGQWGRPIFPGRLSQTRTEMTSWALDALVNLSDTMGLLGEIKSGKFLLNPRKLWGVCPIMKHSHTLCRNFRSTSRQYKMRFTDFHQSQEAQYGSHAWASVPKILE